MLELQHINKTTCQAKNTGVSAGRKLSSINKKITIIDLG